MLYKINYYLSALSCCNVLKTIVCYSKFTKQNKPVLLSRSLIMKLAERVKPVFRLFRYMFDRIMGHNCNTLFFPRSINPAVYVIILYLSFIFDRRLVTYLQVFKVTTYWGIIVIHYFPKIMYCSQATFSVDWIASIKSKITKTNCKINIKQILYFYFNVLFN